LSFSDGVLPEQQVDARRLLERVEVALRADGERLLETDERLAIDAQINVLRELMAGGDGLAIAQQTKRLTRVTDVFGRAVCMPRSRLHWLVVV
jgi:molecular chaperone HscA